MTKTTTFFLCYLITNLSPAYASVISLLCESTYLNKKEALKLKIDEDSGKVQEWTKDHMAFLISGAFVSGLCENTSDGEEGYGYEWTDNFRARSNGATILEMGTTADSYKIAVASDKKSATFNYRDLGSGTGNHSFELTCKKI